MKRVYALKEFCIGCGLCEIYCATVHSRFPDDVLKAYKLSPDQLVSRTIVERNNTENFSFSCRHCSDAQCMTSCITGAIYRSPAGTVMVDENKCVGCRTCVVACPYGSIKYHKNKALKCDLCNQSDNSPTCVVHCPNRALVYEEGGV